MEEIVQRAIVEIDRRVSELGWDFEGYIIGITAKPVERARSYRTIKEGEPFMNFDVLIEDMPHDLALAVEEGVFKVIKETSQQRLRWKLANPKLQHGRYHASTGGKAHGNYVLYVAY